MIKPETLAALDVSTLLKWGKENEVPTRRGPRLMRRARPTDEFWYMWRADNRGMVEAGIETRPDRDNPAKWWVYWWRQLPVEVLAQRMENHEASRAVDAEIEIPCPEGMAYRPFQRGAINYGKNKEGVLLADEMGLGKTIEAIGLVNYWGASCHRILVVTSARLKENWARELQKWLVRKMTVGIADAQFFPRTDVVVINYDVLKKYPMHMSFMWDCVILDEAHKIKNRKCHWTKVVIGYRPTRKERDKGMQPISGIPAKRRLALTGTPFENRPAELWTTLNFLMPEKFKSRGEFEARYCGLRRTDYGMDSSGASRLPELQALLRETLMVRRMKKDVLTELPPKTRVIVELDSTRCKEALSVENGTWLKHALKLEDIAVELELAKATENADEYKAAVDRLRGGSKIAFSELAKVRHDTAVAKLPQLIEALEDDFEEIGEKKILFFAHHGAVLTAVHNAFRLKSVLVTGTTPLPESDRSVQDFQNNPRVKLFCGSIRATGEGLTLTAASLVVFGEEDWVPGRMSQCEDRCLVANSLVWCLHSVYNKGMGLTEIRHIKKGDTVVADDGKHYKVTDSWSHEHRGCMTKINYMGWNEPLICTHDHKILVKRDSSLKWLEAHKILPTDSMAFPKQKEWTRMDSVVVKNEWRLYGIDQAIRSDSKCHCGEIVEGRGLCRVHYRQVLKSSKRPPKPRQFRSGYVRLPAQIEIDEDWLYLFGWYVAEGFSSIKPGKGYFVSFSGHVREEWILKKLAKKIATLGIKSNIYKKVNELGIEMRCYSGDLARWFMQWFGHRAENKTLPTEIMKLPPDQAAIFLRGYTDGDGYQRKKQVEWVTASQTLCYQMCILAIRSGFIPTMRRGSMASGNHWVGGYTKFGGPDNKRTNDQDDNYIYRPVRSVETYFDKVMVYDITVGVRESFTTGFATVHNCHRIGQNDNVLVKHYVLNGSLDSKMVHTNVEKQEIIDKALDVEKPELVKEAALIPRAQSIASRMELERESVLITRAQAVLIHQAVRNLSAGHVEYVSPLDQRVAESLAKWGQLTYKQAALAQRILRKHSAFVPAEILEQCGCKKTP